MTDLTKRSITSVWWNVLANSLSVVVLLVRSVLLARLLPIAVFGVYAGAHAVIGLTAVAATFGMGGAFLHRAPETEDEGRAAAVHFTLKTIFTLTWCLLLTGGTLAFASGDTRTALLLLIATTGGVSLAQTPRLILTRRVVHRRLALLQVLTVLLTTLVGISLAWQGVTLWALLAMDVVTLVVTIAVLYLWKPVWRPRLAWSPQVVRYYLRFGSRNFVAVVLRVALGRLDDLWTRFYLGVTPMGFYSRAFAFATYPRQILAAPIDAVIGGTFAELKGNRRRLSQAFFRTSALLVRAGFFLAGLLALVAPEMIRLLIGRKWLPMLDAFRFMLAFTMLDPLRTTVAGVFIAVGKPERIVRARVAQLVVLLVGVFSLGPALGITGVAVAVNAMLLVGLAMLLLDVRTHVDTSLVRLFLVPTLALMLGVVLARLAITYPGVLGSDWRTASVKIGVYALVYLSLHWLFERREIIRILTTVLRQAFNFEAGQASTEELEDSGSGPSVD